MNDFLSSFRRVYLSAKVKAAIGGTIASWTAAYFASASVPVDQRIYLWMSCVAAMAWMVQQVIAAWQAEDVADKSKPQPPAAIVMTGDDATNVQVPPVAPAAPVQPRPAAAPVRGVVDVRQPKTAPGTPATGTVAQPPLKPYKPMLK